ncbi:LPXTG cell wall anchor domain-containing protein [Streptomyces sp. NPDC056144]|uniref:LPXTG cell wall anchor domain-containing protein n=1 Tax=unclassified Streptomyces TaxID=2593676 RepID=UPI0035DA1B6D
MRRTLISAGALVAALAGSLALAPVGSASEAPKPLRLHQIEDLPLTAAEFGKDKQEKVCGNIPTNQDGWHFVLTGRDAVFTKLTVEFEPGGTQTITVFGPPDAKHAYAGSLPGAKLVSASAEISGSVKQDWFNLSHTCPTSTKPVEEEPHTTPPTTPGTETTPPTTETTPPGTETTPPTTETTPPGTESPSPSETTPGSTESPSPSETPGASETPGGTESPSATTPGEETTGDTGSSTGSTTGGTDEKGGENGSTEGDLAETGSSAPVGIIAAVAVALAGAGAFLVTRRRKAAQQG